MATAKKTNGKLKDVFGKIFTFPMSPRRQFRRLMILGAVILVLVIAYHVYFFQRIESEHLFQASSVAPVTPPGQTVNDKKLTMILQRFSDKEKTRGTAIATTPSVTEPSK